MATFGRILVFFSIGFGILVPSGWGADHFKRTHKQGEYLVGLNVDAVSRSLFSAWADMGVDQLAFSTAMAATQVYRIHIGKRAHLATVLRQLHGDAGVSWIEPNYVYRGDPREFESVPERSPDPLLDKQFHHEPIRSRDAWKWTIGIPEILVAVTDDGMDLQHEDLKGTFYKNDKEIPANGIDDDKNGLIDDVQGWDFTSGKNDPSVHGGAGYHGTHVCGLIGANQDNGLGGSGVAPGVKILPIKFYDPDVEWTSEMVIKAMAYAVNQGAKIISTSYAVDEFWNDGAYRKAVAYAYRKQVLLFNSAGNSSFENPRRSRIDELVLICSTHADHSPITDDLLSSFSNFGNKIHVCAPGGGGVADILSTVPHNGYAGMSGTSMATPVAAGVAALIWSKNPGWTRDQVLAQLLGTADPIDKVNPQFAGKLGDGRINALRSVSERAHPPSIRKARREPGKIILEVQGVFDPLSANQLPAYEILDLAGRSLSFGFEKEVLSTSREIILIEAEKDGFKNAKSIRAKGTVLRDPWQNLVGADFVQGF